MFKSSLFLSIVPNITLSKQDYNILENEGMLILTVQREEVLDVRTVVNILSDQLSNAGRLDEYYNYLIRH